MKRVTHFRTDIGKPAVPVQRAEIIKNPKLLVWVWSKYSRQTRDLPRSSSSYLPWLQIGLAKFGLSLVVLLHYDAGWLAFQERFASFKQSLSMSSAFCFHERTTLSPTPDRTMGSAPSIQRALKRDACFRWVFFPVIQVLLNREVARFRRNIIQHMLLPLLLLLLLLLP